MRTMQYCAKVSFSGVTGFQKWEGEKRVMQENSLRNLINMEKFIKGEDTEPNKKTHRNLNQQQQRQLRKAAGKLAYYSARRTFEHKTKKKKFHFKVAFLTLTAPNGVTDDQFLAAFEGFLSYLRRTANCVYVWKKELGDKGNRLHVHLLINNFIPYYIVSWKWKRLLIGQGFSWPVNKKGEHYNAHTRIEIPRTKKQVSSYISKYMAKGSELPIRLGRIFGFSDLIKECDEIVLEEGDYSQDEIRNLKKIYKVIEHDFFTHICCDPATVRKIAPHLYKEFSKRAIEISYTLSLPQRFHFLE